MKRFVFWMLTFGMFSLPMFVGCGKGPAPDNGEAAAKNEVSDDGAKGEDQVKYSEQDYRKFVEGLASPNRAIVCVSPFNHYVRIPPEYEWESQKKVEVCRKILFDHCEEALPALIDGCIDSRYSMTSFWGEYVCSLSVGSVCQEIVASHIETFRKSISFFDPPEWHRYNFISPMYQDNGRERNDEKKKLIDKWWSERKKKSLRELQLEAFDWAIEKRNKELSRAPSNDRLSEDLQRLGVARDALRSSNKCLPTLRMARAVCSPNEFGTNKFEIAPWSEENEE
jgi:hypothetical protein